MAFDPINHFNSGKIKTGTYIPYSFPYEKKRLIILFVIKSIMHNTSFN